MTEQNSNFAPLKNDRFLRALLRQPVDRTPVWMMRQAGRYLPEYRATRAQAGDFMSLCKNTELACEVTLQPLRRYAFDAAILFSDILTIPDAMGQGLYFSEGEGPKFKKVIRTPADVEKLPDVSIASELSYVTDAVALIRRELNGSVPLIGFSGSPWTLATYMIEGGGSKVPVILFTKNGGQWLESIAASGCNAVGLDWTTDIANARERIGSQVALQGNMDPSMLYASPEAIRAEVGSILAGFGSNPGHVFNLGHGITPAVNPDNVGVFVESVHELSAAYHDA